MKPGLLALTLTLAACAPILPPDKLADVDRVRDATATQQAKQHAPAAFAQAEKLRKEAHAAFEADNLAGAQITAERALAAYAEAVALARVARAEEVRVSARKDADDKEKRLAAVDAELQLLNADVAVLERRLEVLRNAEPLSASKSAKGAREEARKAAVSTFHFEATLLCAAAEMLARSFERKGELKRPAELKTSADALAALDKTLADKPPSAPIDEARRARASCLTALTKTRRAVKRNGSGGSSDAMLAALSKLGKGSPRRDERGVVLTLRDVFDGNAIKKPAAATIEAIADVAGKHPEYPVMVIVHGQRVAERGETLVNTLRSKLGQERVAAAKLAGGTMPIVDPDGRYAARNERIDIVFVSVRDH